MCMHIHHKGEAHLRALEALGIFNALLCYLSLIFKRSETKRGKKHIVDQILGRGGGGGACTPVVPPSKSATA